MYERITKQQRQRTVKTREGKTKEARVIKTIAEKQYRMSHRPNEDGAPISNMAQIFPDDIYSPNGIRYYGSAGVRGKADRESYDVIKRVKDNPEAEVTIYRAVPPGIKDINPGDWVSVSKTYAEDHAVFGYGPNGDQPGEIISQKVKASEIKSPGDDLNEYGYFPGIDKTVAQDPYEIEIQAAKDDYFSDPNNAEKRQNYLNLRGNRDNAEGKTKEQRSVPVPAQFGSTTDVALDTNLNNSFTMARDKVYNKGRDFKLDLQAKSLEAQEREGIDLSTLDDANIDRLADFAFTDALEALKDNQNAIGWYGRTVDQALKTVAELHPEVLTDPKAKMQFIWATAVTSNGLKVDKNFELALDVYETLKETGRFPTDAGIGQAAKGINFGLGQYHTMLDKFNRLSNSDDGAHALLADFMDSKFPLKQLEKEYDVKISGEGKDTLIRGAAILGPKIGGGFYSNLYGKFDELTMDRWLMRTVGRWRGGLVNINKPMIKKKTTEIKGMMKSYDLKPFKPLFLKPL